MIYVGGSWSPRQPPLALAEAVNLGAVDLSADVADTVPVFAESASGKLVLVADEAPSPSAQAILVPAGSPIGTVADLPAVVDKELATSRAKWRRELADGRPLRDRPRSTRST